MKVGYYPGCSLESTAEGYNEATINVLETLGVDLVEIDDWNCCGSTPAHQTDHLLALGLSARNLVQAEEQGLDKMTAPCAACYNHIKQVEVEFEEHPEEINNVLEKPYKGGVSVYNLIEILVDLVGIDTIESKVKKPLRGLKVAPFYGCLLTRPAKVTNFDHPTDPQSMDRLLEALGAEVVDWGSKTDCCGASYVLTATDIVLKHSGNILKDAKAAGADVISVACPLCQLNLDSRQTEIEKQIGRNLNMPILYITELLALSLGFSKGELDLEKRLVSPKSILKKKSVI
ncbi:CoB--CoM heterodisulfide reductase iron-sulfur subunit B family protein [Selenihalanaerobacter shriftii]|uniref:Heterodisulfide reductase subunit B n=1 Tax=Selenihalanaerobacter shriftii TaxID=142842 RepID=A0A1T4QBY5_9FIRM|nr:CoB--CoM heterodisulfide reductase iron-sulfur subunit B family protein [Selenihalanaerobacter shriftii]SKA01184.1 heterodisulfide reductase subunit B [Selenihalanaerobacter shriftii]